MALPAVDKRDRVPGRAGPLGVRRVRQVSFEPKFQHRLGAIAAGRGLACRPRTCFRGSGHGGIRQARRQEPGPQSSMAFQAGQVELRTANTRRTVCRRRSCAARLHRVVSWGKSIGGIRHRHSNSAQRLGFHLLPRHCFGRTSSVLGRASLNLRDFGKRVASASNVSYVGMATPPPRIIPARSMTTKDGNDSARPHRTSATKTNCDLSGCTQPNKPCVELSRLRVDSPRRIPLPAGPARVQFTSSAAAEVGLPMPTAEAAEAA